jgi:hypothetical protein
VVKTPDSSAKAATDRRDKELQKLFSKVISHHVYVWKESVHPEDIEEGQNIRLTRVSCDVLLCGPMTIDQVKACIKPNQTTLKLATWLPKTFLS